jgi:hypothetical protein
MTMPPMPPGSGTPPEGPPELPRWAQKQNHQRSLEQPSEAVMAAFIGPKWDTVYRRKMAPFFEDASFVPTWNWAAALAFPPAWFLYRKLYLPFAFFFLMPGIAFRLLTGTDEQLTMTAMQQPENEWLLMMNAAIFVSTMLASGGTANWFLFRRARAANRLVAQQQLPAAEAEQLLRRVGGVNKTTTALFLALSLMIAAATIGG